MAAYFVTFGKCGGRLWAFSVVGTSRHFCVFMADADDVTDLLRDKESYRRILNDDLECIMFCTFLDSAAEEWVCWNCKTCEDEKARTAIKEAIVRADQTGGADPQARAIMDFLFGTIWPDEEDFVPEVIRNLPESQRLVKKIM